jgi:D-glycero-D-manno-heptose 1,7-bisphosphate phosphatase
VEEAVVEFKNSGFLTIVVTNQPDVKRGWVTMDKVEEVNERVYEVLQVDEIKCCFHDSSDDCECRKPRPGMIIEAARDRDIDLEKSFMIGDRYSDIEAGNRAGCRTILVGPGDEESRYVEPDFRAQNLLDAARWILSEVENERRQ